MTLVRFQPAPFQRLLSDFWNPAPEFEKGSQPVVNILETVAGFRLELAVPGFSKEHFQIKLEKNLLTIAANMETGPATDAVKYYRHEFKPAAFERSFRLPESIDTEKVNAHFNNGILYIDLVKKPELQPISKAIEIQ